MKQHTAVQPSENLLTIAEVAKRLRVDGTTVRRWANNNTLDVVVLPHAGKRKVFRIKQSTVDALLQ